MKKYLKNNKNGTKTVKEVYGLDNDNYAGVKAHELLRNPKINNQLVKEEENLKKALIKQGITAEKIAERVGVLLDAEKVEYKNNNATGKIEEVGRTPDYQSIDKGLKHATNIFGVEDMDKKDTKKVYNFFYQPEFQQNISNYDQFLKKQVLEQQNAQANQTTEKDVEAH